MDTILVPRGQEQLPHSQVLAYPQIGAGCRPQGHKVWGKDHVLLEEGIQHKDGKGGVFSLGYVKVGADNGW